MNQGQETLNAKSTARGIEGSSTQSRRNRLIRRVGCAIVAVILGSAVGTPILVLTMISRDLGWLTPYPSDQDLIERLRNKEGDFATLLSMFEADKPIRSITPTSFFPVNGLSETRWGEYRKIFSDLGIKRGMYGHLDSGMYFVVETKGLSIGGSSKGLAYRPLNPKPIYESLDRIPRGLEDHVTAYRKIDDDWYITFEAK